MTDLADKLRILLPKELQLAWYPDKHYTPQEMNRVLGTAYLAAREVIEEQGRLYARLVEQHIATTSELVDEMGETVRLRAALRAVLDACDQGRMVSRGAGGMTIEAQFRNSVYNGVPAWPVEEARAALAEKEPKP